MRYIVKLLFILSVSWISPVAHAALSTTHESELTGYLVAISNTWEDGIAGNDAPSGPPNDIFINPSYTSADFEEFFKKYLHCNPVCAGNSTTSHIYTDGLKVYIGYIAYVWPRFYSWLGAGAKLQTALINPMWTNINSGLSAYPTSLGNAMSNDVGLRQNMLNSAFFFTMFAREGTVSDQTIRSGIYDQLKNRINTYPDYFKDGITLDAAQPYVAMLREHIWEGYAGNLPMTPTLKDEIAVTIGLNDSTVLSSKKKNVWSTFTVLAIDNNGLDNAQLDALNAMLAGIPRNLHDLRFIFFKDYYYPSAGVQGLAHWGRSYGAVDTFGTRLNILEQQFASDASPRSAPLFMTGAAHEFHHIVEWYQHKGTNPAFQSRRDQLFAQAGNISGQYLRCNIDADCGTSFQASGGEFFASIANDYITDSWNTLDLAIIRFNAGYKEPLNQFLFFADTHSQGGLATKIYTISTTGAMTVSDATVTRDATGRIVTLRRDDSTHHVTYQLTLDANGNVTSYSTVYDADLAVTAVGATPASNAPGGTSSVSYTVCNNEAGAAGEFSVGLYLSLDTVIGSSDIPLGNLAEGSLAAGTCRNGGGSVTIPSSTPVDAYYILAVADVLNQISEVSETDNDKAGNRVYLAGVENKSPSSTLPGTAPWRLNGGCTTAHQCVSDSVDGTYIDRPNKADDKFALFGFSPYALPADVTVDSVEVSYKAKRVVGSAPSLAAALKVGGTNYAGSLVSLSDVWVAYPAVVWTLNPRTSLPWTLADINGTGANSLQGFGVYSDSRTPQVTTVSITVKYRRVSTCALPGMTTKPASAVGASQATLNGEINPEGCTSTSYFQWKTSTDTIWSPTTSQNAGSGTVPVSITSPLSGLSPNTPYFFRLVGQNNAGGPVYGADMEFTTPSAPVVTTVNKLPTSNLSVSSSWNLSGCAAAYMCVDDPIALFNTSDFLQTTNSNRKALFNFSPFAIPAGSIISRVRLTYVAKLNTGSATIKAAIQVGGTMYSQPTARALTSTYTAYSYEWTINPKTAVAWTVSDINGTGVNPLQGIGVVSGSGDESVTQVYVTVEYQ